jgi:hypothetical protein
MGGLPTRARVIVIIVDGLRIAGFIDGLTMTPPGAHPSAGCLLQMPSWPGCWAIPAAERAIATIEWATWRMSSSRT